MIQPVGFKFLLLLTLALWIPQSETLANLDSITSSLEYCCKFGREQASKSCSHYEYDFSLMPSSNQKKCKDEIKRCCRNEREKIDCDDGIKAAKNKKSCKSISSKYEICCKACELGLKTAAKGKDFQEVIIGEEKLEKNARQKCFEDEQNELLIDEEETSNEDEIYDEDNEDYNEISSTSNPNEISVPNSSETVIAIHSDPITTTSKPTTQPFQLTSNGNHSRTRAPPNLRSYASSTSHPTFLFLRKQQTQPLYFESKRNSGHILETCDAFQNCEYKCLIIDGHQRCLCKNGYKLSADGRTCKLIDGSLVPPVEIRQIKDCGAGFFLNSFGFCEDIDECKIEYNECGTRSICRNKRGSFECLPKEICRKGFRFNSKLRACEDIDECHEHPNICDSHKTCNNTIGSYTCEENYEEFRKRECEVFRAPEIPEQIAMTRTPETTTSRTTTVSYSYRPTKASPKIFQAFTTPGPCPRGFERNQKGYCEDIDECSDKSRYRCPFGYLCRNLRGEYTCIPSPCGKGYMSEGGRCEDLNECLNNPCPQTYNCINTYGSYKCEPKYCPRGYRLSPSGECTDMDECSTYKDLCRNGDCINTDGSYECRCFDGFRKSNHNLCRDINECAENSHGCGQHCSNTFGSYTCRCSNGYTLDTWNNKTCTDIDECEVHGSDLCTGECVNTDGGFECDCPDGFKKINGRCDDINECDEESNICAGEFTQCVNTIGSYKCMDMGCDDEYKYAIKGSHKFCRLKIYCGADNDEELCQTHAWTYTHNYMVKTPNCTIGSMFYYKFRENVKYDVEIHDFRAYPENNQVKVAELNDFSINHNSTGWQLVSNSKIDGPQDIELDVVSEFYSADGTISDKHEIKMKIFVSGYATPSFNSRKRNFHYLRSANP